LREKEAELQRRQREYEKLQKIIDDLEKEKTLIEKQRRQREYENLQKKMDDLVKEKKILVREKTLIETLNNENSKYLKDLQDQRRKVENLEKINKKALSEISQLNVSNTVINKKLAEHQEKYERDMKKHEEVHEKFVKQAQKELDLSRQESAAILKTLNNERRKYAYDIRFAKSKMLKEHLDSQDGYPNSFNIQIIGERGVGKSSLINFLVRKKLNLKNVPKAKTGYTETTTKTSFFDVTKAFENVLTPDTSHVFFVDQPGIGGAKINRNC